MAGFTFGNGGGTPAPGNNASTAPSSGSGPASSAPTPAAAFTFGSGGTAATTSASSTAPPPSSGTTGGGFAFGGTANPPTGSSASTAPVAPATGFTLGGPGGTSASSTPSAAATSSATFGSVGNAAPTPTANPTPANKPSYISVPEFTSVFPGLSIAREIRSEGRFDEKNLATLLQVKSVWNQNAANPTTRQTLHQQKTVLLSSVSDPSQKEEAFLNDDMLQQLFSLADDLALTEEQALSLMAKSKQENSSAETLYWNERKQHLETLLYVFQKRLAVDENQGESTTVDNLLNKGLVGELVQLISDFSKRLDRLTDQQRRHKAEAPDDASRARQSRIFSMHIDFASQQRQIAAETLFFIAYNFHLEIGETIRLLQLIRSLSNGDENNLEVSPGLRPLDPYNVPSAYSHNHNSHQQPQTMWIDGIVQPSTSHLEEKNPFIWQKELVDQNWENGHPQLLRCVATLLMAAASALDQRTPLHDRGNGKVSLPTEDSTKELLNKVHPELYAEEWKTPHILGLLLASYALTLQSTNNPAISSPLSPRAGPPSPFHMGAGSNLSADVRRTFRHALEAPTLFKTFSFSRISLIPALHLPKSTLSFSGCNTSEFLLSVLTELTSGFFGLLLRHNPPISRAQWEKDAEEDLRLRRKDQENYRQFQSWSGTRTTLETIPDSVDLLQRPDCMDDVLALCYDVCRLDANFAACFWKKHSAIDTLSEIEKMQREDESLLPGYVDLMSGLSFHAPNLVHSILSGEESAETSSSGEYGRIIMRWTTLLETLRYYARELVNKGNGSSQTSAKRTNSLAADQSTMYYYYSTENNLAADYSATSSSSSSSTMRELGEANTRILSSHLMLVESIASKSSGARDFLRNLNLPITSGESAVGQDSLFMVLFSLTSAPISPELRGLVFESLASIIDGCSEKQVNDAWACVEDYGILPIDKLLVYTTPIPEGGAPRILFPPSSTARVNEKHCKSWIPANPSYALIYEMEYIEASRGVYPSTAGFLRLLRELIHFGGCPGDLGRNWRTQAGCSPYLLYVTELVLPRATGTFRGIPSLPFRCSGDRDRLLSLGFDVVATCLRRYIVPDFANDQEPSLEKSLKELEKASQNMFSLQALLDRVLVSTTEVEFKTFISDFVQASPLGETSDYSYPVNKTVMNSGVPKPKSPGFLILGDLLNRTGSLLLDVIGTVLSEGLNQQEDVDRYVSCFAVYGPTPPTVASAKAGRNYSLTSLLLPLRSLDRINVDEALSCRQMCVVRLLETLCSAACREKHFTSSLDTYKGSGSTVPIVKFQARPSAPDVKEIQLSLVGQLLNDGTHVRSIVELIGSDNNSIYPVQIACAASGFLFYLDGLNLTLSRSDVLLAACKSSIKHLSSRCDEEDGSVELLEVILNRILVSLRVRRTPLLLNVPILHVVVESVAHVLNRSDVLETSPMVAATCYEVLFRSMNFQTAKVSLSRSGFWTIHIGFIWKSICGNTKGEHSYSWLSLCWAMAGVAEELHDLGSSDYVLIPSQETSVLRPHRYSQIMTCLSEGTMLENIINQIPLSDSKVSECLSWGVHLLVGAVVLSSSTFRNPIQLNDIVDVLLERLAASSFPPTTRNLSLAVMTALDFQFAVSDENPLKYVQAIAAHVSSGGDGGIVAAPTLSDILRRSELPDHDFPQHVLRNGISFLLRVSCATFDTTSFPIQPKPEACLARICLKTVLPRMDEDLVQRLLTDHGDFGSASTAVDAWIGLVSSVDGDVVSLLKQITGFSFGSDMLLDRNILHVLDMVGERVIHHMQSLESNSLEPVQMGVPVYWQGHLELMTVLLLRVSKGRQIEAANQVMRVLSTYEHAADRVFTAFPRDGDAAVSFIKCCAIALETAGSTQLSLRSSSPHVPSLMSLSMLTRHLFENPLPRALLGKVPSSLTHQKMDDKLVTTMADNQSSWWDSLGQNDWESQHELLFGSGAKGAELVRLGFSIIRSGAMIEKLESKSIARGLCRNVDALKVISHFEQEGILSQASTDAVKEYFRFKNALCQSVFEILRTVITLLKMRRDAPFSYEGWDNSYLKPIQIALDFTRLDSAALVFGDENKQSHIHGVASVLRKLISEK